jgi:Asp-tRNA(Asn)/Glu-tRNA(Gln) amidotransferase B subunit
MTKVIKENSKAVNDYKSGRENAIMFLVGQIMRTSGLKLDANTIKEKLRKMLQ